MHLRTLALALALGIGASLGGFAGRGDVASAAQRTAMGATIASATPTADPFLAAAGPTVELTAVQRSGGPLQLHRSARPGTCSAIPASHPVCRNPSVPASFQSWTERGRREHHLGTPPPPAAA